MWGVEVRRSRGPGRDARLGCGAGSGARAPQPTGSHNVPRITLVSRPPLYASTTFCLRAAIFERATCPRAAGWVQRLGGRGRERGVVAVSVVVFVSRRAVESSATARTCLRDGQTRASAEAGGTATARGTGTGTARGTGTGVKIGTGTGEETDRRSERESTTGATGAARAGSENHTEAAAVAAVVAAAGGTVLVATTDPSPTLATPVLMAPRLSAAGAQQCQPSKATSPTRRTAPA